MGSIYNRLVFPNLCDWSAHDHEVAHEMGIGMLRLLGREPLRSIVSTLTRPHPSLEREVWGMKFRSPIGWAAGLDKEGVALRGLAALGFGFGEIGTVVPNPQPGKQRPRMFRLEKDRALINRMGFNSSGAHTVRQNLLKWPLPPIPIGINAGANLKTMESGQDPVKDYRAVIAQLYECGSYFMINVSSPNTTGLRGLQDKQPLLDLTATVQEFLKQMGNKRWPFKKKPAIVKIAPDLTFSQIDDVLDVITQNGIEGICIGNTTNRREGLRSYDWGQIGGLSGQPLFARTRELVRYVNRQLPNLPIIAAGGISEAKGAAWLLEDDGASLVQIFTALVYEGPLLPKRMNKQLVRIMRLAEPATLEQEEARAA